MSSSDKECVRTTRRSLKTLQHASGIENLVGRPSKSLKHQLTQESPVDVEAKRKNLTSKDSQDVEVKCKNLTSKDSQDVEVKRKNLSSKETQANLDSKVTEDDLTNPDGPSETYWKILAEKRNVALQEALDENEKLRKVIEDLKEENKLYKQMLDEANSFVEVIKEELANASNNDTGIDVNDVSTAEETDTGAETTLDTTSSAKD